MCSQAYFLEFIQQAKHVGHGQLAPATVHQLYRLSALQIDARNQHGSRTCTPVGAEIPSVRGWTGRRREKSRRPERRLPRHRVKISAKCSGSLAPPDAITGTETAREIAAVRGISKPACVPSRSTEVSRISPAPSETPCCAHAMASRPVDSRPPRTITSQCRQALGVDCQHHRLRAEFAGQLGNQFRSMHRCGVDGDFVGACAHDRDARLPARGCHHRRSEESRVVRRRGEWCRERWAGDRGRRRCPERRVRRRPRRCSARRARRDRRRRAGRRNLRL